MSNSNSLDNYKASGEPPSQLTGGELSASATDSAGATPIFHAVGALAGSTTTISPGAPANMVAGMVEFLWVETADQAVTLTTPNGFTEAPGSPISVPNATSTIATRGTLYWRRYTGTASNPTTNDPGDHVIGRRIAVSGCVPTGTPWDFIQVSSEAVEDTSGVVSGSATFDDNRLILILGGAAKPDSNSTSEFNSIVNPNLVGLTERADQANQSGNGGHLWAVTGEKLTSGSVGNMTYVKVTPAYKWHFVIALKPPDIVTVVHEESVSVSRKETVTDRNTAGAAASLSIGERNGVSDSSQNSIGKQVSINQLTGFNNSTTLGMFSVINLGDKLAILHGANLSAQSRLSLSEREGLSTSAVLKVFPVTVLLEREGITTSGGLAVMISASIAERLSILETLGVGVQARLTITEREALSTSTILNSFPNLIVTERDGITLGGNLNISNATGLNERLFILSESSVTSNVIVLIVQTVSERLGVSSSVQMNMNASLPFSEKTGIENQVFQIINPSTGLGVLYSIVTSEGQNVIIVSGFGYVFTTDSMKSNSISGDTSLSVQTGDS